MSEILSNIESVTTAAKIVSAQKVETSQLCIDGKDLQALKEERAPSYKELVTRMELPENEIWALYTDNGDIVYWHNADKMGPNFGWYTFGYGGFNQLPKGLNYEKMTTGNYLFTGCKNLIKVKQDFPLMTEAEMMFYNCSSLKSFQGDLKNLTRGHLMFSNCSSLESFETSNLNNLTNGVTMFANTKISEFHISLPNLEAGDNMFQKTLLKTFEVPLQNLKSGSIMFYNIQSLTSFVSNTPLLTNGVAMFEYNGNLSNVDSDFSSLESAREMFWGCSSLTSFMCKLKRDDAEYSPLTDGNLMFSGCKLDAPSVENILTSLQPFTDGSEHIMTMRIQSAAVEKFNEITGNTLTLNSQYQNVPFRGWTVQVAII